MAVMPGASSADGRAYDGQEPTTKDMADGRVKPQFSKLILEGKAKGVSELTSSQTSSWETAAGKKCDPYSYSPLTKALCIGTVSFGEFIIPFASMTLAPSLPQVTESFAAAYNTSAADEASFNLGGVATTGSFSVTVYMIGLAAGLLLFGSLSDVYGRLFITRSAAFLYTIASIACALSPSLDALIAFRAMAGFFGGAAQVIGGSVVADLYPEGKRDTAVAWYTAGPAVGPAVGSVVGSLINSSLGWRWVFWLTAILSALYTLLCIMLLQETHGPTLQAKSDLTVSAKISWRKRFQGGLYKSWDAVIQPIKIILLPSISLIILDISVMSGWFNVLISSLGTVYQEIYHFPAEFAGFGYIAICLGSILSLVFAKRLTKGLATYLTRKMEDTSTEQTGEGNIISHRNYLPMFLAGTLLFAVAYITYGWACQARVHWIISMVGLFLYGLSGSAIRFSVTLFVIEAVPGWTGSTMSALMVVTSIFGAVLPIATFPMYNALGLGWSYTLMGLISIGLGVIPIVLYVFAKRLKGIWSIRVQLDSKPAKTSR